MSGREYRKERKMKTEMNWFVANDKGELIGHDMSEAEAKALAEEMKEQEPDAGWEALEGE
jgi:hypothetical protein